MPTLLLADGSPIIQRVVELTFSAENVRVVTATDGDDAIGRISTERPDIVLVDIATPARSGYDICAFVKQRPDLAATPVLLLAGAFEPVDDARAQQVGCNGIIVKPFEPQHVVARVKELLSGAHREATYVSGVPRPIERLAPRPAPVSGVPAAFDGVGDQVAVAGGESSGATSVDDSVEEYFQRLDAAMAARRESLAMTSEDHMSADGIPTLDSLLGEFPGESPAGTPISPLPLPAHVMPPPVEPPDATATLSPAAHAPSARESDDSRSSGMAPSPIAEAFSALLAVELGEPGATPVRLTTAPPEPVVTDALVEEVTRRVAQRLGPDALNRVVADVVSEVAERLVREEIARIRQLK